jgi:long-chain acyl-CoA synthetase
MTVEPPAAPLTNVAEIGVRAYAEYGDRPRFVSAERAWTSGELQRLARRLAYGLGALGVGPGTRVVTILPNSPETFVCNDALWRTGAVLVPFFPELTIFEIESRVRDCAPELAIVMAERLPQLADLPERVPSLRKLIVVGDVHGAGNRIVALSDLVARADERDKIAPRTTDDLAAILYSGGTTGEPKGVMLTHRNLLTAVSFHGRERHRTSTLIAPMAHISGLWWSLVTHAMGDTTVILDGKSPDLLLEAMVRHRVNLASVPPGLVRALLRSPDAIARSVSAVPTWRFSGAGLPPELFREFRERFCVRLDMTYGLTESTGQISTTASLAEPTPGSVGTPGPLSAPPPWLASFAERGIELRIVDAAGGLALRGDQGEICVRGDSVSPGYFGRPAETREVFRDGWLRTGDLGRLGANGELFVVGRKKDVIIRGGMNVSPKEIEDVICADLAVRDCVVVGVPNDVTGEDVVAFVVLDDETAIRRIEARCRERLAAYKRPRVERLDSLPRTIAGKVDRTKLVAAARPQMPPIRAQLEAAWPDDRTRLLGTFVEREVREALELDASVELDPERSLGLYGLDSLKAVAIQTRLGDALGCALSPALVFEYPTIRTLTAHLDSGLELHKAEKRC